MEQFLQGLWAVAEPGIILALSSLIVAVVYFGAAWLTARTQAIRDENRRRQVKDLIQLARDHLSGAVKETAQTFVNDRKAAREDGKLTEEEKAEARERAVRAFLDRLGAGGQDLIRTAVPNLQEWAMHELESLLWDQKLLEAAAAASPKSPLGSTSGPSG